MNDPRKNEVLSSYTSSLDDILKGEVLTRMTNDASPESIDKMVSVAKRRFAANALWTIGATHVERISESAQERLKVAFIQFGAAGGTLIIIVTDKPKTARAFQTVAANIRNIPLKIVANTKEANAIASKHREEIKSKR